MTLKERDSTSEEVEATPGQDEATVAELTPPADAQATVETVDTGAEDEVETEVQAEAETQVQAEAEADVEAQVQADLDAQPDGEAEVSPVVDADAVGEADGVADAAPDVEVETDVEAEPKLTVETEAYIQAETLVQAKTKAFIDLPAPVEELASAAVGQENAIANAEKPWRGLPRRKHPGLPANTVWLEPEFGAPEAEAVPVVAQVPGEAVAPVAPAPTAKRRGKGITRAILAPGTNTRVTITQIGPISAMKVSFMLAVGFAIMQFLAVLVLWLLLDTLHVFSDIQEVVDSLGVASLSALLEYLHLSRVLALATVIGVVDVVLITALGTVGAVLYNLIGALVGGLRIRIHPD